ncbi:hypothetical protein Goklo_021008 [Gossypium klotzschianum]|uniref:Uncharacterized protein n=1 Tax=Gossypium klotzschianum TaxID=34286 RepID=A0A7J8UUM5_9ROSI|nr:hypothetical protein [Gossypium klotzschianum]
MTMMDIVVLEVKLGLLVGAKENIGLVPLMDISVIDQNLMEICFLKLREIEMNLELHQKEKGKKHTSIGSSSNRRSSSSNLWYSDSSTSTQGFYPPEQPLYCQPSHSYPQPYGYYPLFLNYGVLYQPQTHPPPPMYHPPPPLIPRE